MSNTRDMTKAEFSAALKRNGFQHEFMGWYKDTTGQTPNVSYGAIYNIRPFRLNRRATIARLIRGRERNAAKAKKSPANLSLIAL